MIVDNVNILEVACELATRAVFLDLTESHETPEEALIAFEKEYTAVDENGDIRYTDEAQELFNQYYEYYEGSLMSILGVDNEV